MRILSALLATLALTLGAAADVLTVGDGQCVAGWPANRVVLPVYVRDLGGTALGVDKTAGNKIQGFSFRILPSVPAAVGTVSIARVGVLAPLTPMMQLSPVGGGMFGFTALFDETTDPVPFTLNGVTPGDRIAEITLDLAENAPAGTLNLVVDPSPTVTALSNVGGTVVEVPGINLTTVNGCVTVNPPALPAPQNFVATASERACVPPEIAPCFRVDLSWQSVAGAHHYEVVRRDDYLGHTFQPAGTTLTDTEVGFEKVAAYTVRAIDASGRRSPVSPTDLVNTFRFYEDPVVAPTTRVRYVHIVQLRNAINNARDAAVLQHVVFTQDGMIVRALHITELRNALNEARVVLGLPALTFTDPNLTAGTRIKAVHIQELRTGVK